MKRSERETVGEWRGRNRPRFYVRRPSGSMSEGPKDCRDCGRRAGGRRRSYKLQEEFRGRDRRDINWEIISGDHLGIFTSLCGDIEGIDTQ